jgi:hypothetical protein
MLDAAKNSAHTENARLKKLVALPLKLRGDELFGARKLQVGAVTLQWREIYSTQQMVPLWNRCVVPSSLVGSICELSS